MSAFVVSKQHIDALVQAGLAPRSGYGRDEMSWYHDGELHSLTLSNADEVGAMLWAENVESVGFRYSPSGREPIYGEGWSTDDEPLPGSYKSVAVVPGVEPIEVPEWSDPYRFPIGRVRTLSPVAALKAIGCYEYQSCEHEGWKDSEAKTFCEALRHRMIGELPGYEEAAWEVSHS